MQKDNLSKVLDLIRDHKLADPGSGIVIPETIDLLDEDRSMSKSMHDYLQDAFIDLGLEPTKVELIFEKAKLRVALQQIDSLVTVSRSHCISHERKEAELLSNLILAQEAVSDKEQLLQAEQVLTRRLELLARQVVYRIHNSQCPKPDDIEQGIINAQSLLCEDKDLLPRRKVKKQAIKKRSKK